MIKTKKILPVIALVFLLIAMIPFAEAATLTASPNNSNIIRVQGSKFDNSTAVSLKLINGTESVYNFTEQITTDSMGNFTAIVIVPTSINGTFNVTASTENATALFSGYTIPDLNGPTGPEGPAGVNGTTGERGPTGSSGVKGDPGEPADPTLAYASIAISLAAAFGVMLVARKTGTKVVFQEPPAAAAKTELSEEETAQIMMARAEKGDVAAIKWLIKHGYEQE